MTEVTPKSLYETDFVRWLETTAQLLRDRKLDRLDFDNLIEEIESMGRSEKRKLYQDARKLVIKKTSLTNIPPTSPYTIEQVLDEDFLLD